MGLFRKAVNYLQLHGKDESVVRDPQRRIIFSQLLADVLRDTAMKMSDLGVSEFSGLGSRESLFEKARHYYTKSCDEYNALLQQPVQSPSGGRSKPLVERASRGFFRLSAFCDHLLRQKPSGDDGNTTAANSELAELITRNLFRAMHLGSSHARERFPRLLELIEKFPSTRGQFSELSPSIPTWMFLGWMAQMLAHLNGEEADVLFPVLSRIADDYPQALYYPFKISSEDLKPRTVEAEHGLQKLKAKLSHPLLDSFVASLEKLTNPEMRFKYWMDEIRDSFRRGDMRDVASKWAECFEDCFNAAVPDIGAFNQKFAQNWAPHVRKNLGAKDGKRLLTLDEKTFEQVANQYVSQMKVKVEVKPGPAKLHHFSSWLANFYQSSEERRAYIELPGRYDRRTQPQPNQHPRIVSFDPNLLVLGSIRRPKRLKMNGNDERTYAFLVKGGEDLRQDQRIEQMFSIMNDLLQSDPQCARRKLNLRTYQVVPMTKKVGILEWVNDTVPLKALIEQEIAREQNVPRVDLLKLEPVQMHLNMLQQCVGQQHAGQQLRPNQQYLKMFQKISREAAVETLSKQWAALPGHYLRDAVAALCASSEAFYAVRAEFARTLAVFNVCSYVLGIGDRHLENFLLDTTSGQIVGIDFGHAFDSATESLPVPELMPFRLTKQLADVLIPVGIPGLLRQSMIHTMSALHESRDILLTALDVFVQEPLVDWIKNAKIQAARRNQRRTTDSNNDNDKKQDEDDDNPPASSAQNPLQWYPQKKIAVARRKLELANPAFITLEEVKDNASIAPGLKYVERVVRGDPAHNVRARIGERCSSIQDQVDALIDQSTDPNILERTWMGWASWC